MENLETKKNIKPFFASRKTMTQALDAAKMAQFPKGTRNPQNQEEWAAHQEELIKTIREVFHAQ